MSYFNPDFKSVLMCDFDLKSLYSVKGTIFLVSMPTVNIFVHGFSDKMVWRVIDITSCSDELCHARSLDGT